MVLNVRVMTLWGSNDPFTRLHIGYPEYQIFIFQFKTVQKSQL